MPRPSMPSPEGARSAPSSPPNATCRAARQRSGGPSSTRVSIESSWRSVAAEETTSISPSSVRYHQRHPPRRDPPCGGPAQQAPVVGSRLRCHEEAQAVGPEQPQVRSTEGENRAQRDVALGHLGVEPAVHPRRRRDRALVGSPRRTGPQDVTVRAEDGGLFGRGDQMAVVAGARGEEHVAVPLDVGPRGTRPDEGLETVVADGECRKVGGRAEQRMTLPGNAARIGAWCVRQLGRCRGIGQDLLRDTDVIRCRRALMVREHEAVEAGGHRLAGLEGVPGCLEADHGVLVLEPHAGQVAAQPAGPFELERVGAPELGHVERADESPGRPLARHVLTDRQGGAVAGHGEGRHVEVLADVVLGGPHRRARREGDVLGVQEVHDHRLGRPVGDTAVPEPGGPVPGETERRDDGELGGVGGHDRSVRGPLHPAGRILSKERDSRLTPTITPSDHQSRETVLELARGVLKDADTVRLQAGKRAAFGEFCLCPNGIDVHVGERVRSSRRRGRAHPSREPHREGAG